MFGADIVIVITAISTATAAILAAAATACVAVIKALREARTVAQSVTADAKATAVAANSDVRADIAALAESVAGLDRKVTAQNRKIESLGKGQETLLEMIVAVDKKMEDHIEESRARGTV